MKKHAGQGGFTLVELLIVVVILGILAAVVVFAVGGINERGKTSACKSDRTSIETAEEAYYAVNNQYAPLAALVPDFLRELPTIHVLSAQDSQSFTVGACTN